MSDNRDQAGKGAAKPFEQPLSELMMTLLLQLLEDFRQHGLLDESAEHVHALMGIVHDNTKRGAPPKEPKTRAEGV